MQYAHSPILFGFKSLLLPPRRRCNRRWCLSVFLFVYLLATLRKNVRPDLHEIYRKGGSHWTNEQND